MLERRGFVISLVFLVTLAALIFFSIRYHNFTHYTVSLSNSQFVITPGETVPLGGTLTITGLPGERVFITINPGNSANGDWASQGGLTLTLNSPSNFSTQLVSPQVPGWSDTIVTQGNSGLSMSMAGSFVIPSSLPSDVQSITGQIAGDIEYPASNPFLDEFTNQSGSINISVQIMLLHSSAAYITGQVPLYLVTCVDIILLLAVPIFYRIYDARRNQTIIMP